LISENDKIHKIICNIISLNKSSTIDPFTGKKTLKKLIRRMKMKTKVLILLAVFILLVPLALLGKGADGEEEPKGTDDPLEFYGWDFMPNKIQEYCDYFAENYDEKVNVHIVPNLGFVPAMQTKIMGGVRMDVMYNFRWNQLRWHSVGWAASMSGMPGADELVEDIIESARPAYHTKDGELISLPYFMAAFVVMYNPGLLEKAGYDHYPRTKDELYEMCKALKQIGVDNPYVAFWIKDFVDRYFFIYLISEGIEVFDENFNPVFQNNPETKKVFNWWVKMYRDGMTSPTILTDTPTDQVVMMQEGRSAFFNLHQYFLKSINEAGAKESGNVALGPQVAGKDGTTLQIGEVVQLGGRTPDPDRAWELIKFYSWRNKEGEYYVPKTWALEAGLLVPYKGFFKDQEIIDSFSTWCDWDLLIDIIENKSKIETVRMQVWYPDWRTEASTVLHKMILEEISVDDAIQQVADIAVNTKKAAEE
jgi:multiple sugar transport system substrate-binding protein